MRPRILLYNPPATYDIKNWQRPMPLNLLSISSLLNARDFEIIISQDLPDECEKIFLPYLDNAICLGISSMTGVQITHGLSLAKKIRAKKQGMAIVWGGYHPTAMPEQTLQNEFVDIIVNGYGEITFSELITRLANSQSYEDVMGISYKKNKEVITNPDRPMPDLNKLHGLDYHLFYMEKFFKDTNTRTLHYITSRGCPHQCGFCADSVIYKRKWNALSAERVVEELERLKKTYNYDSVRFYDSNLFVNEQRIIDICKGVIEKKLDFSWLKCNGDAFIFNKYSEDTFKLMHRAGISNILLGIESGYEPALSCVDKAADTTDNIETVKKLHKNGISIGFSFMFAFPYDIEKSKLDQEHKIELLATMKAISKFSDDFINGDYYLLFVFTPYPGVRLFPLYRKLGFLPPNYPGVRQIPREKKFMFVYPDSFQAWGRVNLDEISSCPWISTNSIKLHAHALRINWFLMHEVKRSIDLYFKNKFLRKYAEPLDVWATRTLKKRIERGLIKLPVLFRLIKLFFGIKKLVYKHGYKYFIKKAFARLKS